MSSALILQVLSTVYTTTLSQKLDHISKRNNFFSIGGCDKTLKAAEETDLLENIRKKTQTFDYDIVVINVTPCHFLLSGITLINELTY